MGIAAYYRGNAAISRGICMAYGCHGCSACREAPKAKPRPTSWGKKTLDRATDHALGLLRYFRRRGTQVTVKDLAVLLRDSVKCGEKTAHQAAETAFAQLDITNKETSP